MIDLSKLKPSTQAPIPIGTLRELPLGGIYLDHVGLIYRFKKWAGREVLADCYIPGSDRVDRDEWIMPRSIGEWRYPLLPRVAFSMTTEQISTPGDQPSGRCKSVTRRALGKPYTEASLKAWRETGEVKPNPRAGLPPRWAKPGALFLAIDRGRRSRKQAPSRGLGVFRVVETRIVRLGDDDGCDGCQLPAWKAHRYEFATICPTCGGGGSAEAAREGFPGISWREFTDRAFPGVPRNAKVARISFERIER